jgi:phage baseplate assembly protein W
MTIERERLFGVDLRVVERAPGLDVVIDGGGDLQLAAGADNIEQALRLRLAVRRGELEPLGWPNYGSRLHELIGEPNNSRTRAMLMAFARAAILEDPRVVEITRIEARPTERDLVRLDLEISLITGRSPLNLVADIRLGSA